MTSSWRPLAVAAALTASLAGGIAEAQTVMIRNAPAGSKIDVVWNSTPAGSGAVDASGGVTTIPLKITLPADRRETDVYVFVDLCEENRFRVVLAEREQQPLDQGTGCRRESLGLFLLRPVSSFLVDVGAGTPTVMLRQGEISLTPQRVFDKPPTGLVIFGGGGFTKFKEALFVACGNVPCNGDDTKISFAGGAAYWLTPWLAGEFAYLRSDDVTAEGEFDNHRFDSFLDSHRVTVSAVGGIPIRRFRPYGKIGLAWHRAYSGTTQTADDVTVTIDGVEQTIEGGTQTFELETEGWSWSWGGGGELWFNQRFAVYGEIGRAAMKEEDRKGSEGTIDERATHWAAGIRIRIGG